MGLSKVSALAFTSSYAEGSQEPVRAMLVPLVSGILQLPPWRVGQGLPKHSRQSPPAFQGGAGAGVVVPAIARTNIHEC